VFFKRRYITQPVIIKADVVASAANRLIDALKGNLVSAHNETEMEALDRLTSIFLEAKKKASGMNMEKEAKGTQHEPPPRVEQHDEEPMAIPRVSCGISKCAGNAEVCSVSEQ
jgi:hypothetical protein